MAEVDYCILSEFYKWILNHEDTNIDLIGKLYIKKLQSLPSFFSPTCPKAKFRQKDYIYSNKFFHKFHLSWASGKWVSVKTKIRIQLPCLPVCFYS